ncbi:hypothetical protein SHO565_03120 [Streptomyces sp. HO565]
MSPGSVTERLRFYAAPCLPAHRTGNGGGAFRRSNAHRDRWALLPYPASRRSFPRDRRRRPARVRRQIVAVSITKR